METIKKTLCPLDERLNFLPTYAGDKFLQYEQYVYNLMDGFTDNYNGGYWEFFHLSNGGFFMALQSEKRFLVEQPANYFKMTMGAEAYSIGVNLYALNFLAHYNADHFSQLYHKLREYAVQHDEANRILSFID